MGGDKAQFGTLSPELIESVDVLRGSPVLGNSRWDDWQCGEHGDQTVACGHTGPRFVGRGRRFVSGKGDIVVVTGSVGELEEGLDIVGLVGGRHARVISLGHDVAQRVPLFPRYVRWGRWVGDRVLESLGELVEPVEVKGDLEPEVLSRGQIAEKSEALHDVPASNVSENVFDSSRPVASSDAVPILMSGKGGRVFVW